MNGISVSIPLPLLSLLISVVMLFVLCLVVYGLVLGTAAVVSYVHRRISRRIDRSIRVGLLLPSNPEEARIQLNRYRAQFHKDPCVLASWSTAEFCMAWAAFLYQYPAYHPDDGCDFGTGFERALHREAWRRYNTGDITDDDLYMVEASQARIDYEQTRVCTSGRQP